MSHPHSRCRRWEPGRCREADPALSFSDKERPPTLGGEAAEFDLPNGPRLDQLPRPAEKLRPAGAAINPLRAIAGQRRAERGELRVAWAQNVVARRLVQLLKTLIGRVGDEPCRLGV